MNAPVRRMSKKEKRLLRQQGVMVQQDRGLRITEILPLTDNQERVFDHWEDGKNLLIHGSAGTGKSFLTTYLALDDILSGETPYQKLVVIRSAVQTRDQGFMPGGPKEKIAEYQTTYNRICTKLFNNGSAYEQLKQKGMIDFMSTSFLRGDEFDNTILFCDEMQNCTFHELDTIITRAGKNSRVVFAGDFDQTDLVKYNDKSGMGDFCRIIQSIPSFASVGMREEDICRSGLVRDYIIAKNRFNREADANRAAGPVSYGTA